MPSIQRTLFSCVLLLFCFGNTSGVYFCDVKTFDTVFNIGHLIYFVRCGEIWTYDPTFNGDEGGLIRDYSPLIVARELFADDVIRTSGGWSNKALNITGFSFQNLSCVNKDEDSRGKCRLSVIEWQHLTFFMAYQSMYAYHYDIEYIPRLKGVKPLNMQYHEDVSWSGLPYFFPKITDIAPKFPHFDVNKMEIRFGLFDSIRYYLYLAIKHEEYHCITYINMEKMLFDFDEWPVVKFSQTKKPWVKAHCFVGVMHGMFFHKNQAYIVGQVLTENRIFDDQVYKMYGNGGSRPEFELLNVQLRNGSSAPQNLRDFFGCSEPKPKNILRMKRSLQEPVVKIERQKVKRIAKRVANNLLIQFVASVIVLGLAYKLLFHRLRARIPNKSFNNIF